MKQNYDVIVIGAGHAGVEAAYIANKLGRKTALISFNKRDIAFLPCNVSIGGSAKGIVVREIFALGGLMPLAADETQLQTKILNLSKGASVWALRAQVDKINYPKYITETILNSTIDFIEDEVLSLIINNNQTEGVITKKLGKISSKAVIICTGTFLRSKTMMGSNITEEGPDHKQSSKHISKQLEELNIKLLRLKTGTPPRIFKDSIDFSKLEEQPGSDQPIYFTEDIKIKKPFQNQTAWLGYTTKQSHQIINNNLDKSYLYSTEITGQGPKYCPSIEDKVKRFNTKNRHQIFFELESEQLPTIYLAGLSSSMPKNVQEDFIHQIAGLENAKFALYAYAIEYDAIQPEQLYPTLEFRNLANLYFAGQVNGTSGYEEAAAQGLIAGINATNKQLKRPPLILNRNEAYIGVMIDDLTTKGVDDPYRLLTSRAEYRLLLRNDNVVKRLYQIAYDNKLITNKRYKELKAKFDLFDKIKAQLWEARFKTNDPNFAKILAQKEITLRVASIPAEQIIKRPEFEFSELVAILEQQIPELKQLSFNDQITLGIEIKFAGYLEKQEREIKNYLKYQKYLLPKDINYRLIPNLASEAIEKLSYLKPLTINEAAKIPGVNPADILILFNYFNKQKLWKK